IDIAKKNTTEDEKPGLPKDINKVNAVLENLLETNKDKVPITDYDKINITISLLRKHFKFGELPPKFFDLSTCSITIHQDGRQIQKQ
ncbi:34109_t:CDS:1, partial [Gigaspora margarita]